MKRDWTVGLWIDRDENGRKQSRKLWFKVLLQRTFFRAVVAGPASIILERWGAGAECLGQAGRSRHISVWQTHLTLPWDTRGAFWVFLRDWHDIPVPRNAPAVKEGGSWGALTPLRAGMVALTLFSSGVSQFPGQQRVQALLLDSVCSSSCSQDYPGGACSDTLCCYPTGTEPLCTAQVRTTHQGF